jgi:hypothetical protein
LLIFKRRLSGMIFLKMKLSICAGACPRSKSGTRQILPIADQGEHLIQCEAFKALEA